MKTAPTLNLDGVSVKGCSYIYAPSGQAGEYAPLAANPYKGCGHQCAYCLSPDTLIQMAGGETKSLADVQVGDILIGVTERDIKRRAWNFTFERSEVLAKIHTRKPAFAITLDDGHSAVCSADHRWLTERGWKNTQDLTTNNSIRTFSAAQATPTPTEDYKRGYLAGMISGDATLKRYDYSGRYRRMGRRAPQGRDVQHHFRLALKDVVALDRSQSYLTDFGIETHRFTFAHAVGARAPMEAIRNHGRVAHNLILDLLKPVATDEWSRGWLAGIFDAEGGTTSGSVRIHNTDEAILARTEVALETFGFRYVQDAKNANGCGAVRVLGGLPETARFFNLTAPAIGRKFPATGSKLRGSARIVSIEPLGDTIDMVDITTSTENFIANGMVSHNCYVPRVLRRALGGPGSTVNNARRIFDEGAVIRPDFKAGLLRDAAKYKALGITEQVMLSFTTDPYPPQHHDLTRWTLQTLQEHGLGICTLTKGGSRALRDLDLFRPDRDAFASTLTSLDAEFSRKWERGAADPEDRISTLRKFHERGVFTWVSLEPTIDVEASLAIVDTTHEFVDLYKVGRVNYVGLTKTTDWRDYTLRIIEKLQRLGNAHYIKKDLQPFLPAGYHNPLRARQYREFPR